MGAGGSVGDGCPLASAGGGHGAPRRLPAPPRPRPPQRALLAGAGAAPPGGRLPRRTPVRAALRSAPRLSAPRSAPRPARASPPPGGPGVCVGGALTSAPCRGWWGGGVCWGTGGRASPVRGEACGAERSRCPPNLPFKSPLRHTHAPSEAAAATAPHEQAGRGHRVRGWRGGCVVKRALGHDVWSCETVSRLFLWESSSSSQVRLGGCSF